MEEDERQQVPGSTLGGAQKLNIFWIGPATPALPIILIFRFSCLVGWKLSCQVFVSSFFLTVGHSPLPPSKKKVAAVLPCSPNARSSTSEQKRKNGRRGWARESICHITLFATLRLSAYWILHINIFFFCLAVPPQTNFNFWYFRDADSTLNK